MDVGKFISMLTTNAVYFACPAQFNDPFEGTLPKSYIEAEAKIIQGLIDPALALRKQLAAQPVPAGAEQLCANALGAFDASIDRMRKTTHRKTASGFGVSCWHESEYESEAMWKLYAASGQGIAIESTIGQLRACFGALEGLQIGRVRYRDFEHDPIEKGHTRYKLFVKRKAFEHEKEVRATVPLPKIGVGIPVPCDLDVLITRVHLSPLMEGFVREAITQVCAGRTPVLRKLVQPSLLYLPPDDEINLETE
jgi:hypothetical protein